jgi:hypothetical protein
MERADRGGARVSRTDRRRRSRPSLFGSRSGAPKARTEPDGVEQEPTRPDSEAGRPPEPAEPVVRVKPAPRGQQKRTMPRPVEEAPEVGWRLSRRSSRTGKQARRQAKAERVRSEFDEKAAAVGGALSDVLTRVLRVGGGSVLAIVLVAAILWGAALGVNEFARWNAKRIAEASSSQASVEGLRENVVVIGVRDNQAVGFVAMKAERATKRIVGIAMPDGAFVEVPGQGFERIGDSYSAGPDVSRDTVSNFLMVPFKRYIVVDEDVYQALVTQQKTADIVARAVSSDMSDAEKDDLEAFLKKVPAKEVWIVPLPVKPITVGSERYYEPQRTEIADIVLQWWGVRIDQQRQALRVILYNGVGTPGVAGKAAQQLIRKGFRVVDSKNADNFDYKETQILLYHGTQADAEQVKAAIGVGKTLIQTSAQNIADVIVIVGADYVPPTGP